MSELGLFDPRCNLPVGFVEGASQGAGEVGEVGKDSAQAGRQESVIGSGKEQGEAQAEVRRSITMRAGDALNELMQSKASQMIGHFPGG
jgi:hypothetical protein